MKKITDVVDIKLEEDEIKKLKEVKLFLNSMTEEVSKVTSRNTDVEVCDLNSCINLLNHIIDRYGTDDEESIYSFSMDNQSETDKELLNTFGDKEWLNKFKKWFAENKTDDYCLRSSYYHEKVGTIYSNVVMSFSNINTEETPKYRFRVRMYKNMEMTDQITCETIVDAIYMYKRYLIDFCSSEYQMACTKEKKAKTVAELIGYYLLKQQEFETLEKKEDCTENEEIVKEMVKYLRMEKE